MLLRSSVSLSTPHEGRPAAGETSGSARSLSKQPSLGIVLLQMLDFALCCVLLCWVDEMCFGASGPAGPSHTHASVRGFTPRGRGAQSVVQAVAVREHTAASQQRLADVDQNKVIPGLDWPEDRPQRWQSQGQIFGLQLYALYAAVLSQAILSI